MSARNQNLSNGWNAVTGTQNFWENSNRIRNQTHDYKGFTITSQRPLQQLGLDGSSNDRPTISTSSKRCLDVKLKYILDLSIWILLKLYHLKNKKMPIHFIYFPSLYTAYISKNWMNLDSFLLVLQWKNNLACRSMCFKVVFNIKILKKYCTYYIKSVFNYNVVWSIDLMVG